MEGCSRTLTVCGKGELMNRFKLSLTTSEIRPIFK